MQLFFLLCKTLEQWIVSGLNCLLHKSVPFWHKWRISAPGITFNNPGIMNLFSYKAYGVFYVHEGGYVIVNSRYFW